MEKKQVVVANMKMSIDAEIAKGHLKASGIEASIIKGGGMLPSLQNTEGVQLVVLKNTARKPRKYFRHIH